MRLTNKQAEVYKKRRYEVMSEEEIKLAEKYLDYYKSAWQDKENRGLFDKWAEIDQYWEGDVNLPESDVDPGSNTNIVHPNVEGQVALLVEQNIAIQTRPVGPSDAPFADTARIILEWIKDKNKMKRKLDVHERRREKFGTGIFRVLFDPDFMDGFGLSAITPCNPAYVFPDPTITDIYRIQEGRFIIETVNKSIHWARQNYDEDRVNAIMLGYNPMQTEYIFGEDEGENDEISRDSYLHMLVFTKEKKDGELKLRLVEMSGCGVILYDSFKSDEPFFDKPKYPYFFTPLYYREGTVWAKGDAELLLNTQNLVDDLDDQIRINARLAGNPQKLIDTASGIDIDKWTNEPALNIPCNDTNGARWFDPPQIPSYVIDRRKYALEYEGQRVTRFSDQMTGSRQQGVDTATEALALQQAGATGIDHKKLLLQETLSEVFEYCLDMVKEYYTEEMAFRITEKDDDFVWFRGSQLKEIPQLIPASTTFREQFLANNPGQEPPKWMQHPEGLTKEAMFDIEITVGAGLPNNKAFTYQMIKEAYKDGAIDLPTYQKLLREQFGLPIEEQQMPAMPQPGQNNQPINLSPQIEGMNARGNPAALGILGGMANANPAV